MENYDKALDIFIKVESIHLVALVYANKGDLYYALQKYSEVIHLNKKALEIREEVLGENHKDTAYSYNCLANAHYQLKEYRKGIVFYKKSIEIRKEILGEDHEDTIWSYHALAHCYYNLKQYITAISFYQKTLNIRREVLDIYHKDTAWSYHCLGLSYAQLKEYGQAIVFYKNSLKIRQKLLGEYDKDTLLSYNNLAIAYYYNKNYREALVLVRKFLDSTYNDTTSICSTLKEIFFHIKKYPYVYSCKNNYDNFLKREMNNIISFDSYLYSNTKKIIFTPIEDNFLLIRFYPSYIEYVRELYDNEIEKRFIHFNFRNAYLKFRW